MSATSWHALEAGQSLPARGEVKSGTGPLTLRLANGGLIELSPGSVLALVGTTDVVLGAEGKRSAERIDLRHGEIRIQMPVPKRGPGSTVVVGAGEVLVGAGASATLRVRALPRLGSLEGGLTVAAYSGVARVATRGAFKTVTEGQVVELRADQPVPPSKPLAAGPAWAAETGPGGGPLAIITDDAATRSLSVRFATLAGVTGYDAEIARDEAFADVIATLALPPGQGVLETPPLTAGRYFARVRTRGPEGLPGEPGPTRLLRIARAMLPGGGAAEGGRFVLPPARLLTWDDPSGLEVSMGRVGFKQASAVALVPKDRPVDARVRLTGEPAFIPFTVAARSVRAEVDLGPKRAIWPFDPVEITVHVVDPDGTAPPVEPRLTVKVNLTEVPVEWWRRGDVWKATLPPQIPPGPWVVRVEAKDEHGNELGRGHLEVIGPSTL
jgi:hypothetical protein